MRYFLSMVCRGISSLILLLALTSMSAQATTIEFWTAQTQTDRLNTIHLLTSTFSALHPNITIHVVPVDENEMAQQLAAASASKTLPQVIEVNSEIIMAIGQQGISDTQSMQQSVQQIGLKRFLPGVVTMLQGRHRQQFGIPFHGWVQGIWYRKDWFKEHHLAAPDNWQHILAAAKALNRPQDNRYGILVGTKIDSYAEQVFTQLALSNNAQEFNSKGQLVFNSPAMLETLKFYRQLAAYTPPGPQTWRARDYYLQGKLGMFFYSTFIMDDLALAEVAKNSLSADHFKDLRGGSFDPTLVKNTGFIATINHRSAASYGTLSGLVALKTTPQQAAATRQFIQFLYQPASYITFLHMAPGGMNPVLQGIANQASFLNDPNGVMKLYDPQQLTQILGGLSHIRSFSLVDGKTIPVSGTIFAKQIIPKMIYRTTIEKMPAKQSLDIATTQIQQLLRQAQNK
ncbi:ABC transporter substrate-binding protein [Celerinatantimonas yamalensis]|uniref:ABC transporter substrate-binding protein n=1 Tax=Celerinatantimonas yamalensis TaxID=559956 RepID=A0ABW9G8H2_9GAMM